MPIVRRGIDPLWLVLVIGLAGFSAFAGFAHIAYPAPQDRKLDGAIRNAESSDSPVLTDHDKSLRFRILLLWVAPSLAIVAAGILALRRLLQEQRRSVAAAVVSDSFVRTTNAVFTSDVFNHTLPEDDSTPGGGRDFILALGAAFQNAGFDVAQMDAQEVDDVWWEHGWWYFFLYYEGRSFTVTLDPLPSDDPIWRIGFSEDRGWLINVFGPATPDIMPRSLQETAEEIIERLAETTRLRWVPDQALDVEYL